MEMQQQKAPNQAQKEEDVLNFDLDDISLEDIDQQAPGAEEEIIELTDLVARGMPLEEKGAEPVAESQEEDQGSKEEAFKLLEDDLEGLETAAEKRGADEPDVTDFALELDLADEAKPAPPEPGDAEEIVSSEDLEAILKDEEPLELISPEKEVISDEKALEEIVSLSDIGDGGEQTKPDLPEGFADDLLKEEGPIAESAAEHDDTAEIPLVEEPIAPASPALETLQAVDESWAGEAPAAAAEPLRAGISEEKLEAVVTKVVQEVLERVARETMASVAERVIGEAIESLKKSLSENP